MKTKVLTLTIALLTLFSYAQYTSIPDSNFEQALIDLGIDSEGTLDGQVLTADIIGVTTLNVSSKGITDLTGIQAFTALETLHCYSNVLLQTLNVL